jgi:hypothetical protein
MIVSQPIEFHSSTSSRFAGEARGRASGAQVE